MQKHYQQRKKNLYLPPGTYLKILVVHLYCQLSLWQESVSNQAATLQRLKDGRVNMMTRKGKIKLSTCSQWSSLLLVKYFPHLDYWGYCHSESENSATMPVMSTAKQGSSRLFSELLRRLLKAQTCHLKSWWLDIYQSLRSFEDVVLSQTTPTQITLLCLLCPALRSALSLPSFTYLYDKPHQTWPKTL